MISKYVAGRDKDARFNEVAVKEGLASKDLLLERLRGTELEEPLRERALQWIHADFRLLRP